MITLNAQLADGAVAAEVVSAIKSRLQARFGVGHATVEIVYGAAEDPACGPATSGCGRTAEHASIDEVCLGGRAVARRPGDRDGEFDRRAAGNPGAGSGRAG